MGTNKRVLINDVTRESIVFNEYIYKSKNYGMFKIIRATQKEYGSDKKLKIAYEIEFKNTGYRTVSFIAEIKYGQIADHTSIAEQELVGKTFTNNTGDEFTVLRRLNKGEYTTNIKEIRYVVKFTKSGHEKEVPKISITSRSVKDDSLVEPDIINNVYDSNSNGKFIVVKRDETHEPNTKNPRYVIRFLDSNYEKIVFKSAIRSGEIRDDSLYQDCTPQTSYLPEQTTSVPLIRFLK